MKLDQLIDYNVRNIFFKNYVENEAGRLVPAFFLFFKKTLYNVKTGGWYLIQKYLIKGSYNKY